MKPITLLLMISAGASALEWTDFRVKWKPWPLDPFHWDSYYAMPRTLRDAIYADWMEVTDMNSLGVTMYCYPNDGQHCNLYDKNGFICGFQAGILVSDTNGASSVYDVEIFNMYEKKSLFGEKYYTTTVYTVNPEIIKAGGRADMKGLTGEEGVWFETTDGYVEIPRNVADLDTKWTKENCIPEMGTHYYYDMHKDTDCKNFLPWFLLYQDDELSGVGLQAFGECSKKDRSWCEWVPAFAIRPTVPTAPQCLVDWTEEYGIISIHYYFTPKPWQMLCPLFG